MMKFLLFIIFVVFWKHHSANSLAIFDYMSASINEITSKFVSTLKSLRTKIINIVFPDFTPDNKVKKKQEIENIIPKTKKAFSDFVDEEAAQRLSESTLYRSLRSEPTALMSTPQLATLHGKRVESHVVVTMDGYLITLHRLKSTILQNNTESKHLLNCTILLHHGLLGSSADWILLGPEKSLPYLLTDVGCDVWLTNARGNYYSRGHISKNVNSRTFWNFSWQEMGLHDLPAVVDYVMKVKNTTEQINFIGHSMGATAFLVMLSSLPEYNKYFRIGVLLAPLVFMANVDGPLKVLTSLAKNPPEQLLKLLGDGEFVPSRRIPEWIANKYCIGSEIYCLNPLLFLSGSIPTEDSWDKGLVARILYHVPAGGSTNTILHYAQMIKSGKFQKFRNDLDEFSLNNVTVPIVLFSSNDDSLATVPDVLRLFFSIACPIDHYVIRGKGFSHTDFAWNPEADILVFDKVIDFLFSTNNCNSTALNEVI